jgi:hypothetical protein
MSIKISPRSLFRAQKREQIATLSVRCGGLVVFRGCAVSIEIIVGIVDEADGRMNTRHVSWTADMLNYITTLTFDIQKRLCG